jgi:signal transduction histidine kinase
VQDVLVRLDTTYQAFFRRVANGEKPGFPRYQRRTHPERQIDFLVAAEDEGSPITASLDADRIKQVVDNYLSNALKYSPVLTPIPVSIAAATEPTGQAQVRVAVHDKGPGLSPDQQIRIWDRFQRVDVFWSKADLALAWDSGSTLVVSWSSVTAGRSASRVRWDVGRRFGFHFP